jgi:hypothetical protein
MTISSKNYRCRDCCLSKERVSGAAVDEFRYASMKAIAIILVASIILSGATFLILNCKILNCKKKVGPIKILELLTESERVEAVTR